TGEPLEYKIGTPYARYHEKDLRKKPWKYLGNGEWEGMFLEGPQRTYDGSEPVMGVEEYKGQPLVLVDYVARTSEGDTSSMSMLKGEENSGIRPVKIGPVFADVASQNEVQSDQRETRTAEVKLTFTDRHMRLGTTDTDD